jgi:hypothetical protein
VSPEKSTIVESPSALKERVGKVERIDPIEDTRYADDGTSPSDKLPSGTTHANESPADLAKSSAAAEKGPGAEKQPAVKTPHESEDSVRPPRGKASVTQK